MTGPRLLHCLFAFAALAVTFAAVAPGARANLIVNGDFEACAFGLPGNGASITTCGWTFSNFAGPENGGNPGKALRLETSGNATFDPTAVQTVGGLTVGSTYTLSWERLVRSNTGGSAVNGPSFGVFLDTQTFSSALFLLPTGYVNTSFESEQVTFTATATSHTFIFAGELDARSNGAGTTDVGHRLDNISLLGAVSVPSPASLALLVPGLLLIAARCRRA